MVFLEADLGHSTAPSSETPEFLEKSCESSGRWHCRNGEREIAWNFPREKEDNRASDPQAPTGRLSLSSEPHENLKPTKARLPGPPHRLGGAQYGLSFSKVVSSILREARRKPARTIFGGSLILKQQLHNTLWRFACSEISPCLLTSTQSQFVHLGHASSGSGCGVQAEIARRRERGGGKKRPPPRPLSMEDTQGQTCLQPLCGVLAPLFPSSPRAQTAGALSCRVFFWGSQEEAPLSLGQGCETHRKGGVS